MHLSTPAGGDQTGNVLTFGGEGPELESAHHWSTSLTWQSSVGRNPLTKKPCYSVNKTSKNKTKTERFDCRIYSSPIMLDISIQKNFNSSHLAAFGSRNMDPNAHYVVRSLFVILLLRYRWKIYSS